MSVKMKVRNTVVTSHCLLRHNLHKKNLQKVSSTNVKEMEKKQPYFDVVFIISPQEGKRKKNL